MTLTPMLPPDGHPTRDLPSTGSSVVIRPESTEDEVVCMARDEVAWSNKRAPSPKYHDDTRREDCGGSAAVMNTRTGSRQAYCPARRVRRPHTPAVKLDLPLARIRRLSRRGGNRDKCHQAETEHPEQGAGAHDRAL